MTHVIHALVYNLKLYISNTPFNITFWLQIDFISCILCIHALYHTHIYIWTTFVKATFSKSITFKVKSTFKPNVLKWVIKIIFINSSPLAVLIINVKILSNFQKEWCTFGRKKWRLKKNKDCFFSRFQCFEHAKTFFYLCQALNM